MQSTDTNHEFEALLDFLKRNRGFDFTGYKRASLMRRVNKRMQEMSISRYMDYVDFLKAHPDEYISLFNTILINVTGFFRDTEAWDFLAAEVIPQIKERTHETGQLRAWCIGSASGEEAYTLAMVLAEAFGVEEFLERVKIYATDADEEALVKARHAQYTAKEIENIPYPLLEKYFDKQNTLYSFRKDLRRVLIFGRHDIVQDAPISRIDLLTCRNVLMYLNSGTQARVLSRLHYAMKDNGFIFLGKAEMLLSHANFFMPVNLRYRIFQKVPNLNFRDRLTAMAQTTSPRGTNINQDQLMMQEALFQSSQSAKFVINLEGLLTMANEQAKSLFSLKAQDYGQPFQNLELSYRPVDLRTPTSRVMDEGIPVTIKDVEMQLTSGELRFYEVRVLPLQGSDRNLLGVSIAFAEVTANKNLLQQLEHSNQELETAMEELQSTNEELETTNEELQSTIEELETTNEELQSANEELETMNEELQSTNQEMVTINDELNQRNQAFNQVNNFFSAILESISGAVIVLDPQLQILVWNQKSEDLWGLRFGEVQNQHFLNLDIGLPVEQLTRAIRACLSDQFNKEEIVLQARNRRGKDIACRVIMTPLLGTESNIEGVIIVMDEVENQVADKVP